MIGSCVGNYHIVQELGSGAMGTVYEAVDTLVQRPVAIKVLRSDLSKQPDLVERFRSEAVTLARLNHPNIAMLYSFFQHEGEYFMAMEYVHGRPLESLICNSQSLEPTAAASIMTQVLEGVAHAHRMGVLHRDIKPANILVAGDGRVKVTDFGIARVLGSSRATRHGRIIGTLEYIAPERIRGDESDPRSDLYSVGVVLYEMIAGRLPFTGTTDYELLRAHLEQAPPALLEIADHSAPDPWNTIVHRALEKSPEHRFQSAEEFQRELLALSNQQSASCSQAARVFPVAAPGSSWKSKFIFESGHAPKALLLVAASVLLILSITVGLRLRTLNEQKQPSAGRVADKAPVMPAPATKPLSQPQLATPEARALPPESPKPSPESPVVKTVRPNPSKATQRNNEQEESREATVCALNQDTSPRCRDLIRKQTLRALK